MMKYKTREAAESALKDAAAKLKDAELDKANSLSARRGAIEKHLTENTAPIRILAGAAEVNRNYIDRIKAKSGAPPLRGTKGNPVRQAVYDPETVAAASAEVSRLTRLYDAAVARYKAELASRDAVICDVSRDDWYGPTDIGKIVGLDRNSVMRITRAGGVPRKRDRIVGQVAA